MLKICYGFSRPDKPDAKEYYVYFLGTNLSIPSTLYRVWRCGEVIHLQIVAAGIVLISTGPVSNPKWYENHSVWGTVSVNTPIYVLRDADKEPWVQGMRDAGYNAVSARKDYAADCEDIVKGFLGTSELWIQSGDLRTLDLVSKFLKEGILKRELLSVLAPITVQGILAITPPGRLPAEEEPAECIKNRKALMPIYESAVQAFLNGESVQVETDFDGPAELVSIDYRWERQCLMAVVRHKDFLPVREGDLMPLRYVSYTLSSDPAGGSAD